jgi:hypothetical protein
MKIFTNFRPIDDPMYDGIRSLDKQITLFFDFIPQNINQLNINPYNFIWLSEPNEFFGMHTWVLNNYHLFTGILTWNDEILEKCPNAIFFHYADGGGLREVNNEYLANFVKVKESNLKFEVSFLSGAKSLVSGHRLRQEIYKVKDQVTVPKKWFYVLDDFNHNDFAKGGIGRPNDIWNEKKKLFTESMFHIAVENVHHKNWYTEKIADAMATKTVPIYNGCPNLGDLGYDERGIIRFNSPSELVEICNSLTPKMYEDMKPYIEHNYNEITKYRTKDMLDLFFKEVISINNL